MPSTPLQIAENLARFWQTHPSVVAVAVAGSQASGQSDPDSDIDVYIYTSADIPAAERLRIGRSFSPAAQIVDYWGPGLEWDDPETGTHLDNVFFSASWMEDQIERVMARHEASLGYTTAFLHTVRGAQILFDRTGWFAGLKERALRPYPAALVRAIVALNFPPLRRIFPSYRAQLAKAAGRGDLVSLNHRSAAFLASYFDILFAINRVPHPGEKRLLDHVERLCPSRPDSLRSRVERLLSACTAAPHDVASAVDSLCDPLESLLLAEDLLEPAGYNS